ncbi:MAG TPA: dTDP-4-dehydrorhamnose reductase [Luteibacter sp.]|uniref:dTDP-4-dehydrorhamnose reductase n=1 Tax=Luteibacter sp. TaxID=1886636 RepID=UPI002CBDAE53|nr:dTDP-4-dehydrorhamnose reductase [Luteibacter sp.]HVI53948.1 dTDP-4-dehydrorhamnose reductase [Luteibacter sp.]
MKILLLGADGQLGGYLHRTLPTLGEVHASSRSAADDSLRCDLSNPAAVHSLLDRLRPDLVVNAAAYTAVDQAESDVDAATRINAVLPGLIGSAVANWGGAVIHYSTDYVFDGTAHHPYTEDDATAPLGVYGRSKLAGEQALAATGVDHLVLRTAWVYSLRGRNFLTTMLRLGAERDTLSVVDDQHGTPTSAGFLARATTHIADTWLKERPHARRRGVFHLTAAGAATWHGFATAIFDEVAASGRLPTKPSVRPIATADYPTPAKRPAWSVLDTTKTLAAFGVVPPDWRSDLRKVLAGDYDAASST